MPEQSWISERFLALELGNKQRLPIPDYTSNDSYREHLQWIHEITLSLPCLNHWTPDQSEEITRYLDYYYDDLVTVWYKDELFESDINRIHCLEVAIDTILYRKANHEPSYQRIQQLMGPNKPVLYKKWSGKVGFFAGEYRGDRPPKQFYLGPEL
ncbi:MAG: hypothetical protein NUV98_00965 [Candidatus Roizmanbacteria bacterium]|nr:hypothetical protein [Candidatus Roizmanbacteria bacterium]